VNARHLAADAKWYIHLDFEAARETAVFKELLDAARAQFPVDDGIAQLKAALGVNPLTDIAGVSIYNNSFEKDAAAVVIYAKVDAGLLNNAIAQNPDYKETPYAKHVLLSWTDNNDGKSKTGCFYGDGIVLMADKPASLKLAVDVLDGTKPGGSTLVKPPAKGAFLYAAANLAQAGDQNISQLLSNSDAVTACVAEADGNVAVTLNLTAKTAEQAAQLKRMLDGFKAFGALAAGRDMPTAAALIEKLQIAADGAKVIASFQHDSKTLLQTLQKLDEENKARANKKPAAEPNRGL
jgi:hypothetical protein